MRLRMREKFRVTFMRTRKAELNRIEGQAVTEYLMLTGLMAVVILIVFIVMFWPRIAERVRRMVNGIGDKATVIAVFGGLFAAFAWSVKQNARRRDQPRAVVDTGSPQSVRATHASRARETPSPALGVQGLLRSLHGRVGRSGSCQQNWRCSWRKLRPQRSRHHRPSRAGLC